MTQRILCPTDLTANSKDSVAYALTLARRNGAQLIVFHTTSFPSLNYYPCELELYLQVDLLSQFKVDQVLKQAETKVRSFVCARFEAEARGIAWKPKVALGGVAEEIVAAALQEEVDLIVMARRKRGMLARALRPSISEKVTRTAPCPVLSIYSTRVIRPSQGWRVPILGEVAESS
jgi:nucleotide-binding universal stress UspA family protein